MSLGMLLCSCAGGRDPRWLESRGLPRVLLLLFKTSESLTLVLSNAQS